jgi:hypothetical protein
MEFYLTGHYQAAGGVDWDGEHSLATHSARQ